MATDENSENQNSANRYHRQQLITGWNQGKLKNARVSIIGSGSLAQFTLASLVSLGLGTVEIYDDAKVDDTETDETYLGEFLLKLTPKEESKVKALETILSQINPQVQVIGIDTGVYSVDITELLGKPDIIIDTSNERNSQEVLYGYALQKKIPIIIAVADDHKGEIFITNSKRKETPPKTLESYVGKAQNAVVSEVLGGIITEECRKIIMPFKKTEKTIKTIMYNTLTTGRFYGKEKKKRRTSSIDNLHALIVGGGALGNFVGIGLAIAGIGQIVNLDFDTVETTNLPRQLLFYDAVGEKKAIILAKKLRTINGRVKTSAVLSKLDEHMGAYFKSPRTRPDIIMDCVDNFATRAILNYYAIRYKIPLVSGGTSPSSGQVVVYKPRETACLDCQLNIDKALSKERTSHSCIYAPQPSVIMTNEIIGGLMVGEALKVLATEQYGDPIHKVLKYDSTNPARVGYFGKDKACRCKRGTVKSWLDAVDAKYIKKE
jgi:molybdopterin-synthase adenylyltransferase